MVTPLILFISYILVIHQQNEQQHIDSNELVCNNPQSKYQEAAYNHPYTLIVTRTLIVRAQFLPNRPSSQNKASVSAENTRNLKLSVTEVAETDSDWSVCTRL